MTNEIFPFTLIVTLIFLVLIPCICHQIWEDRGEKITKAVSIGLILLILMAIFAIDFAERMPLIAAIFWGETWLGLGAIVAIIFAAKNR